MVRFGEIERASVLITEIVNISIYQLYMKYAKESPSFCFVVITIFTCMETLDGFPHLPFILSSRNEKHSISLHAAPFQFHTPFHQFGSSFESVQFQLLSRVFCASSLILIPSE